MPLRVPPPETPVITWLSPNKGDQGAVEFWNTELASYVPLDVGAAHPNQRQYPNFRLGKQAPVQGDEKWVIRTWVTDETSPDWFNWALKYSGEDNAFPIFIHTYREPRATYTPRVKGTPLGTLYKTVMTNVGSGYASNAYPTVTFDLPTVEPTSVAIGHGVASADGSVTEVVLDFGGEGYAQDVEFSVAAPITGDQATGVAYVQPQIAILVKEEASLFPADSEFYAQYLQVTRVYETIPGPTFYETKLDVDGAILTIATTRKLCASISTGEAINAGTWCKTTKKPTDIDVICEEVVECRPIPGNSMESTKIDEDGIVIFRTQTYVATSAIVSSETISGGNWIKKYEEDVDGTDLVSWQWVETRAVPGNAIPYTKLDDDGKTVTGTRTLKDQTLITTIENIIGGVWTHTFKERVTDLVSWQVTESRPVPGNPMVDSKPDKDGNTISVVKTLKDATTITIQEVVSGGNWVKTSKEAVSDLVAHELVEARPMPGTVIPSSNIGGDQEVQNISAILKASSSITPSSTESGGIITTVEAREVSDLVSNQVTTTWHWVDKAFFSQRIPDSVIPVEFRAAIPTVTVSHILAGTASAAGATLSGSQLFVAEQQLTKLLYEHRTEDFGTIPFPIVQTNYETTEEYGGGILQVVRTLDNSIQTVDQGESVVRSEVHEIGQSYLWFKETASRYSAGAWQTLTDNRFDKEMQVRITEETQVVPVGYTPVTVNGVSTERVKGIDIWRTQRIKITKIPTAVNVGSAIVEEVDGPFQFPGILYQNNLGTAVAYYVKRASAQLCQHILRTWWVTSATKPTRGLPGSGADVEVQDIIMDDVIINNLELTGITYSGMVLHDGFVVGTLFYPATTPSATVYVTTMVGNEIVVGASIETTDIPEQWKIQTKSVIAR